MRVDSLKETRRQGGVAHADVECTLAAGSAQRVSKIRFSGQQNHPENSGSSHLSRLLGQALNRPILNVQARYSPEFTHVVGNQDDRASNCLRRDWRIKGTNRRASTFELCSYLRVPVRIVRGEF